MASSSKNDSDSLKAKFEQNKIEYEEMKRRLLETEEKLQNLHKLEEEVQSVASETSDRISSVSNHQSGPYRTSWYHQDEFESISSALGTVPGSYTGFVNRKVASSTPAKRQTSNKSKPLRDGFESDGSTDSTKENRGCPDKYERKLLLQNQRLLLEVERLIGDLHTSKIENASLVKEADEVKRIPDLQERIEELTSESKAQDKALRAAEKTIEEGCKRNAELQKKLEDCQAQLADLSEELDEHKETKKAIEEQRDEAVQNVIEMQECWENYQLKTKEKIRKLEETEDALRDTVATVSQERDDLLDQLADIQTSLSSQEAQINRLLHDVEHEDAKKHKAERENEKLVEQLDHLTAQLNDFEKITRTTDCMRQEKLVLEKELTEHRLVAQDVAELLALFQKKGSKNIQNYNANRSGAANSDTDVFMGKVDIDSVTVKQNKNNNGLEDEGNCSGADNINNNGFGCEGSTSMIGELRSLFCNMDGEIQRLRCDVKQRDADERTYQNLREELKILMEKVEGGMTRNQDLECMVNNLEEVKKTLENKLGDACRALEERDREIQCLDTRLAERNRQVVCLQEDLNDKAQRIIMLEKELREVKQQLDYFLNRTSNDEHEEAVLKIKKLEGILAHKEVTSAELEMKLSSCMKEKKEAQLKYENKISCLCEQLHELQRQLEMMVEELDNERAKHRNCAKAIDEHRRGNKAKDETIRHLQAELEDLKTSFEEKELLNMKMLENCQDKLNKSSEQVQQLESALMMCKNEVFKHLKTMEEIKNHFEDEILHKDTAIGNLKECLRKCQEDLSCKNDEVLSFEQSMSNLKCKVEQMFASLKESENNNNCLIEKLKLCENQNLQDRACCLKETEELDRKLSQVCSQMGVITDDNLKLKQCLQDKISQIDGLNMEKSVLARDLNACKQKACELQEQLTKMETDNTALCEQLHHKMECIKDLETALYNKEADLKTCTRALDELNKKWEAWQQSHGEGESGIAKVKKKLQLCHEDLNTKSQLLMDCEECLKQARAEILAKENDVQLLEKQLEECRCKLQERIVKIEELENGIELLHKDTEKRMKRVDEQLRRYENELTDKCRQLTDMDECLNLCQQKLTEKTNEYCQLEQRANRLCSDIQAMDCKIKEMEEQRDCCIKQLNAAKAENAEITQELRVTREELQKSHQELVDARQALGKCNRDYEKANRQVDECNACLEQKNIEIKKLMEEKNVLCNKMAQLQVHMENEAHQVAQQLNDLNACKEKEIDCLKACLQELEENNACLHQKFTATHRQLQQVEKCCHQKLDGLNRELEDLLNRLADREDEISACKEQMNLKESEIMRLKLRLCNSDMNNCSNMNCSNINMVDPAVEGQFMSVQDDLRPSHNVKSSHNRNTHPTDLQREDIVEQTNRLTPELLQDKVIKDTVGQEGQPKSSKDNWPEQLTQLHEIAAKEGQDSEDRDTASDRNSLGVSDVHERLRSNQRLQMEIEKQLKSLEEHIADDDNTSA